MQSCVIITFLKVNFAFIACDPGGWRPEFATVIYIIENVHHSNCQGRYMYFIGLAPYSILFKYKTRR